MSQKIKPFTTHTLEVKWGHLHEPDTKFGEDSANHSVTVSIDKELQDILDTLIKDTGATKINGIYKDEDTGMSSLKTKSKIFVKKGQKSFPCRDAKAEATEAVAFGGDTVRLRLAPMLLARDNSLSLFLNGVQIIEKKETEGGDFGSAGFTATEGFDGSDYKVPSKASAESSEEEMGDIPF
jgi:hypothetical protein